jgi:hypothetical protein
MPSPPSSKIVAAAVVVPTYLPYPVALTQVPAMVRHALNGPTHQMAGEPTTLLPCRRSFMRRAAAGEWQVRLEALLALGQDAHPIPHHRHPLLLAPLRLAGLVLGGRGRAGLTAAYV